MSRDYVIFHKSDHDGECSAAIAYKALKERGREVELIGVSHTSSFDPIEYFMLDSKAKDSTIYILDFAYKPAIMQALQKSCKSLVWIDHHISAMNACVEAGLPAFPGYQGTMVNGKEWGAAYSTWNYFYPGVPHPDVVIHIAARDVWRRDDPDTDKVHYGLLSINTYPDSQVWPPLLDNVKAIDPLKKLIVDGEVIARYQAKQDRRNVVHDAFETWITMDDDEYFVFALNVSNRGSGIFEHAGVDPNKYDIWAVFSMSKEGQWSASLYSPRGDVDCSEIAKRLGGGGHKSAAGFSSEHLPEMFSSQRRQAID